MSKTDYNAIEKTAYRLRQQALQNGQSITQSEAKKIVSYHLNRADNKKNRG